MIDWISYVIIIAGFLLSLIISSIIIRSSLPRFHRKDKEKQEKIAHASESWYKDLGFWIGFFETLIIFVFVAHAESAVWLLFLPQRNLLEKKK